MYIGGDILKNIVIQRATNPDINKIVKILNDVTVDLLSKDINQWEYPWEENVIKKDIEDDKVYMVLVEGHPVGTFSVEDMVNQENEFMRNLHGKYLYRVAVLPRIQGLGYGKQILEDIKEKCGFTNYTVYLDCWTGNEKLKNFYSKAGLNYVGDFPDKDYCVSVYEIS